MKKLLIGLVVVIILVLILGAVGLAILDAKGADALGIAATSALGVETNVGDLSIDPLRGEVRVQELTVANPPGYSDEPALDLKDLDIDVTMGSLLSDTVELEHVVLDGLHVRIEQSADGSNFSTILDNVKRTESDDEQPDPEKDPGGGKKFRVGKLAMRNISADVQFIALGGKMSMVTVEIDDIELDEVTSENAQGVLLSELSARIMPIITAAVMNKMLDVPGMSAELMDGLSGQLTDVTKLMGGDMKDKVLNVSSDGLKNAIEGAGGFGKMLGDVSKGDTDGKLGEDIGKAAKDVGGAIGNLLGGKKDEVDDPAE